jgi:transcriptional regulator with XRE-family HTH domain
MMFHISLFICYVAIITFGIGIMITGPQMRAARALLGIDQKTLAQLAGLSVPTIQRMEAGSGNVRGVVDSLTKVVAALELAGIELIGEGSVSTASGRGVRLKAPSPKH